MSESIEFGGARAPKRTLSVMRKGLETKAGQAGVYLVAALAASALAASPVKARGSDAGTAHLERDSQPDAQTAHVEREPRLYARATCGKNWGSYREREVSKPARVTYDSEQEVYIYRSHCRSRDTYVKQFMTFDTDTNQVYYSTSVTRDECKFGGQPWNSPIIEGKSFSSTQDRWGVFYEPNLLTHGSLAPAESCDKKRTMTESVNIYFPEERMDEMRQLRQTNNLHWVGSSLYGRIVGEWLPPEEPAGQQ